LENNSVVPLTPPSEKSDGDLMKTLYLLEFYRRQSLDGVCDGGCRRIK
jgi:hypothetical protein